MSAFNVIHVHLFSPCPYRPRSRSIFPFLKQLTMIFVPVSCGPTPSIANAVCTAMYGWYGDVVNYSCLPGYSLSNSGTGQRTCDISGTWVTDNTDPVCEESEKENEIESVRKRGKKTEHMKHQRKQRPSPPTPPPKKPNRGTKKAKI